MLLAVLYSLAYIDQSAERRLVKHGYEPETVKLMLRERYERHAPEFLGVRIPLEPLRRTMDANGLDLVGTAGLGTLYASAWAVRRPGPLTPGSAG